ncbi:MAG: hypothetical protein ACFFEN_08100 [Candidatus Thorarchaeota archaeon]
MKTIPTISQILRITSTILCLLGGSIYIWVAYTLFWFLIVAIMGIIAIIGAILEIQALYSPKYPKGGSVLGLFVAIYNLIPLPHPSFGLGFIYLSSPLLLPGIIILLIGGIVGLVGTLYEKNSK